MVDARGTMSGIGGAPGPIRAELEIMRTVTVAIAVAPPELRRAGDDAAASVAARPEAAGPVDDVLPDAASTAIERTAMSMTRNITHQARH